MTSKIQLDDEVRYYLRGTVGTGIVLDILPGGVQYLVKWYDGTVDINYIDCIELVPKPADEVSFYSNGKKERGTVVGVSSDVCYVAANEVTVLLKTENLRVLFRHAD